NRTHLPDVEFPFGLELTETGSRCLRDADAVVMAIPSRFARQTMAPIVTAIPREALLISVSKGIEQDSIRTMSQMLTELAPPAARIAVLSGPGFALEIAQGKPAALVAAAHDEEVARSVQNLFAVRPLRVYRSLDVVGVELGGTSKNVIAIASGISDGLALGA